MLTGAQATTGGRQPRRGVNASGLITVHPVKEDAKHGKHVMKPCQTFAGATAQSKISMLDQRLRSANTARLAENVNLATAKAGGAMRGAALKTRQLKRGTKTRQLGRIATHTGLRRGQLV